MIFKYKTDLYTTVVSRSCIGRARSKNPYPARSVVSHVSRILSIMLLWWYSDGRTDGIMLIVNSDKWMLLFLTIMTWTSGLTSPRFYASLPRQMRFHGSCSTVAFAPGSSRYWVRRRCSSQEVAQHGCYRGLLHSGVKRVGGLSVAVIVCHIVHFS